MTEGELDGHDGGTSEVRGAGKFTVEERELIEGAAVEEIVHAEGKEGNTGVPRDGSEVSPGGEEATAKGGVRPHGMRIEAFRGKTSGDTGGEGLEGREGRRAGSACHGVGIGDGTGGDFYNTDDQDGIAVFLDSPGGDVVGGDELPDSDGAVGGGALYINAMLPGDEIDLVALQQVERAEAEEGELEAGAEGAGGGLRDVSLGEVEDCQAFFLDRCSGGGGG